MSNLSVNKKELSANKLLYLFVPTLLLTVLGMAFMSNNDMIYIIIWQIEIFLFGLSVLPLTFTLFNKFSSGGYLFSKMLGILCVGLIVWTLTYIGITKFTTTVIVGVLLFISIAFYLITPFRNNLFNKFSERGLIERCVIEEVIFCVALFAFCYFHGFNSAINGEEKFMDFAFLNSMVRSDNLPAPDMWMSGYTINYYYFGQYLFAMLTKLFNLPTCYTYSLSMCTAIALPFAMCYSIGNMLLETLRMTYPKIKKFWGHILGAFAGLFAMVFGNTHSFFYDENCFGNNFLKFFSKLGIDVGQSGQLGLISNSSPKSFFYPDSTRFIGYNPDSSLSASGSDYTIHEFPFYSYLIGDLHAHVISLSIVLLIIAFCILGISNIMDSKNDVPGRGFKDSLIYELLFSIKPELIISGILLGCAIMCNYWDFLIYFIVCSMTSLIISLRSSARQFRLSSFITFIIEVAGILIGYLMFSEKVITLCIFELIVFAFALFLSALFSDALSRTGLCMSFLFTVGNIVAMTFNLNFDMISNKIALCEHHTSVYQFLILWSVHLFICLGFIVFTIINAYKNKQLKTIFRDYSIADIFVCGMIVIGFMLLMAPEIFYVRDIYTNGYLRANTMFKFTFAAFVILSICMAYAIVRILSFVSANKRTRNTMITVGACLALIVFLVPGHYTKVSLYQRFGKVVTLKDGTTKTSLSPDYYLSLNGISYIENYSSLTYVNNTSSSSDSFYISQYSGNLLEYYECIRWFNDEVEGDPVICESYGESYTDFDIVSAYTGLPTVCGWTTHEWLWRFHGIVDKETNSLISDPDRDVWALYLMPRHTDIDTIYTSDDPYAIQSVIDKYDIQYIVIGGMEKCRFMTDNSDTLASMGTVVFTSANGNLEVIEVTPN